MHDSGLYRRVLAGFAWQGASKAVIQSVSWIGTIVVARLLDPADYGVVAVANVFIVMLNLVMEMGLSQGLVQKTEVSREEEDAVFWLGVLSGLLLYLLLYGVAPIVADFYAMPVLEAVLRVGGLVLIIGSVKAVPMALVMRRMDFRFRAICEMTAAAASIMVVVTLAVMGAGVWSLVIGTVVHTLVLVAGYLPTLGRLPRPVFRLAPIIGIVRYGLHLMAGNLAFVVSNRADIFIIGKFLGERMTGFYSMAFMLATMPLDKIGSIFNHVAFSSLSRTKDDAQQCRALFMELHRQLLFITYPLLVGMALVVKDAVTVFLTDKWLPVVPITQVLVIVGAVRVSGMLMPPLLNSRGRARWSLAYSLAGMVLLPAAFLVGVQYGLTGVAVAWIAAYPLLYAMLLRFLRKDLGIRLSELLDAGRSTLVAVACMAVAVMAVQHYAQAVTPGMRLGLSVITGMAAYAGTFVMFYEEQIGRMRDAVRVLRTRT
jgi:O-antigen/teichoic acid export membrane protein